LVLAVIARLNEIPPMLHQNLDLIKRLDALQVKKQKPCTPLPRDVALLVAETKVDLAMQTYELLDQHAKAVRWWWGGARACQRAGVSLAFREQLDRYLVMRSGNPKTQVDCVLPRRASIVRASLTATPQPLSPQALNMEVDPNEPTYCVCGQVAFGEMISCKFARAGWRELASLTPPHLQATTRIASKSGSTCNASAARSGAWTRKRGFAPLVRKPSSSPLQHQHNSRIAQ
jgi:hypothetical protein